MSQPIGEASIVIGADASGFTSDLEGKTKGPLAALGSTLADALGTTFKVGMAGIAAATGALISTSLTKGMGRLKGLDNAEARFRGLGITGGELDSVMRSVNEAVIGTSYGLDEAATAAALLATSGVQAGKEMDAALAGMVTTAAASGAPLSEITSIWQNMATTGKVSGNELFMLQKRGVNAAAALAEHFGITAEEANKMVKAGEVSFEDLNEAMVSQMGGMAEEMGNTFEGLQANIGAGMGRLGAAILGPLFEGMKPVMSSIVDLLRELTPMVTEAMAPLAPIIEGVFSRLASALGSVDLGAAFKGLSAGISSVSSLLAPLGGLALGALGPLLSGLPVVGGLFSGLTGPVGLVIGLFVLMFQKSEILRTAFGALFEGLGAVVVALAPAFTALSEVVGVLAGTLGDVLGNVIIMLVPLIVQLAEMIGPVLGTMLTALVPLITTVGEVLSTVFLAVLETLVPIVLELASMILPMLAEAFVLIVPVLQQVAEMLGALAMLIIDLVVPVIEALLPVFQVVFDSIMAIVAAAMPFIEAVINTVMAVIRGDWSAAWDGVKSILSTAWNLIKTIVSSAINIEKSDLSAAWRVIKSAASSAWNSVKNQISTTWNNIKSTVSNKVDEVKNKLSNTWNNIKSTVTLAWNAVKNSISSAWDSIITTVRTKIDTVILWVKGLPGRAVSAVGDLGSKLVGAGKALIQGFLDGITSMWGSVKKKLGGLTSLLPSWKGPPAKDRSLLVDSGKMIMDGLVRGLDTGAGKVESRLQKLTSEMSRSVMSNWTDPTLGFKVGNLAGSGRSVPLPGSSSYGGTATDRQGGSTTTTVNNITVEVDLANLESVKTLEDFLHMLDSRTRAARGV